MDSRRVFPHIHQEGGSTGTPTIQPIMIDIDKTDRYQNTKSTNTNILHNSYCTVVNSVWFHASLSKLKSMHLTLTVCTMLKPNISDIKIIFVSYLDVSTSYSFGHAHKIQPLVDVFVDCKQSKLTNLLNRTGVGHFSCRIYTWLGQKSSFPWGQFIYKSINYWYA